MNGKSDKEKVVEAISTVQRYESYRVQKLWGIALISIPLFNFLYLVLFETTTLFSRNAVLIYTISQSVLVAIITSIFCYNLIQTKKLKIKDSEIISTYYVGLGIALFLIFYFFAIHFMVGEFLERYNPPDSPWYAFPFILFGYPFPIESAVIPHDTFVYWGDNIAFLISYFLLRNSIKDCKFKELLYSTIFLFIFDPLAYILDAFAFKSEFFGNGISFFAISSFISVFCGIYSIRRAYKTLDKQSNLSLSDINV